MSSNIDPQYPAHGNATTQSVRDNFATAKEEIEALQAAVAALPGWTPSLATGNANMAQGDVLDVTHGSDPNHERVIQIINGIPMADVDVTPSMTAGTTNGVTVAASSSISGHDGWEAFSDSSSTYWQCPTNTQTATLDIDLGQQRQVGKYSLTARATSYTIGPKDFKLQGSSDGTTWVDLDTQTGLSWSASQKRTFTLAQTANYRHYRLNVTGANAPISSTYINLGQMELLSPAVNDYLVPQPADYLIRLLDTVTRVQRMAAGTADVRVTVLV